MSSTPARAGNPIVLSFSVALRPQNVPVPESALDINHERNMHVVGVRKDLNEFFHIHPTFNPENTSQWFAEKNFAKPGEYKVWPEVTYRGETHVFGEPLLTVAGTSSELAPAREILKNVIVGNYQVGIEYDTLGIGDNPVHFLISDVTGKHADLDNFLGVPMHLAVISEDLTEYVHAHPEGLGHGIPPAQPAPVQDESQPHGHSLLRVPQAFAHGPGEDLPPASPDDEIRFALNFTKPGFYKAFAQFRPRDAGLSGEQYVLAEFWLKVGNTKPVPTAPPPGTSPLTGFAGNWWAKLLASLFLMALLSFGVKKYLATPPTTRPTQVAAAPSSAAGEPAAFRVDVKNKYFAVIAAGLLIVGGGVIYRSYFIAEADKPVVTGIVREMKIVADKDEWRFTPEELIVDRGDKVVLTVVNEDEYDHGIAIDAFGISQRMPALETIKVEFVATQAGEFPYYCSVPCGEGDLPDGTHRTHFDMVGRIKVRDTMHSDEMMDQMMDH
jgi:plastocyanin